jgi:hypothetical protein
MLSSEAVSKTSRPLATFGAGLGLRGPLYLAGPSLPAGEIAVWRLCSRGIQGPVTGLKVAGRQQGLSSVTAIFQLLHLPSIRSAQ